MTRAGLFLLLFLWLQGTAMLAAQGIRQGTIEHLDQDNGSLTISGQVLPFSDAVTQVFLEERQIPAPQHGGQVPSRSIRDPAAHRADRAPRDVDGAVAALSPSVRIERMGGHVAQPAGA